MSMPNNPQELKEIIKELNRITPDVLEKVMENTVQRLRICQNSNRGYLKDIIFI